MEAKQTENGPYEEGTITKLTDASTYTVGEFMFLSGSKLLQ